MTPISAGSPAIVGFVPTPFGHDDEVDATRLVSLAARLSRFGIRPAVLGGMGEFYALSRRESRICMEAAVEGSDGREPTVAGIGFATREAVHLAEDARAAGVQTIVINPPHHAAPSPAAYAEHVRRITESSGLPAVLYSSAKYPLTDRHLDALTDVPGFLGVKEEYYDVAAAAKRIAATGDRVQWWGVGEENGVRYAAVGATAVTTSLANFSPGLARDYITQALAGTLDPRVEAATRAWTDGLGRDEQGAASFLKEVMRQTAGWNPAVRLPLLASGADISGFVADFVERFDSDRIGSEGAYP
ncbi:hypothetical protein GCM10023094_51720 [Rhodococcus olei]|uniref:4-hydroxy-tetrahydrodipicolinate synthase n=1 Tax=Rhodococcus olei TaxID=2161675 RepID=A0ABP8PLT7_9NOCA